MAARKKSDKDKKPHVNTTAQPTDTGPVTPPPCNGAGPSASDPASGVVEQTGIDDNLRIRRKYTMSEAALFARRQNAKKSTGPRTPEGKKRVSRNNWKHGRFASTRILGLSKPCKSTCPKYPCSLVIEGKTEPGGECLDKQHIVEACMAIEQALLNNNPDDFYELAVFELAESMQVIRELRRAILEDGAVIKYERYDKEGKVVGHDVKPHPALLALPKILADFGLTLPDFRLTPKEVNRSKDLGEAAKTVADIFQAVGGQLEAARRNKA
jgi:hypothetical protein